MVGAGVVGTKVGSWLKVGKRVGSAEGTEVGVSLGTPVGDEDGVNEGSGVMAMEIVPEETEKPSSQDIRMI